MKIEIIQIVMGVVGVALIVFSILKSRNVNRKLLSVLWISFLIFFTLSWIIPVGTYSGGKLTTNGISPVGFVDLFNKPVSAFVTFALYGVTFATIGGLYGVIEKTGALEKVTSRWAKRYDEKGNKFLILTVVLFTVLSSFTGLVIPLFVLVPLFAATLLKLNYKKVTVLAATVGSLIVGDMASTYGFNISGYTKNLLSLDMNDNIWTKLILLVLLICLFSYTLISSSKREKVKEHKVESSKDELIEKKETKKAIVKEEKKEVKKAKTSKSNKNTKNGSKKSNTKALAVIKPVKKVSDSSSISGKAMLVLIVLMLIISFVGMYNWYYSFGISLFNDMHEAIMGVKIKDFSVFGSLLGGVNQFGYWSNIDFVILIVITSMIIGKIYKLSFNDYLEGFIAGVKKWAPTAIYTTLASIILVMLYQALQTGAGTLVDTINGSLFGLVDGFNSVVTGVSAFVSGFFFNDLYYLLADLSGFVTGFDASSISIAGLIIQSVYGVAMMIFPTSAILIAGLSYFDVSYKEWFKFIWRFVLIAFLLILLVCGILTVL